METLRAAAIGGEPICQSGWFDSLRQSAYQLLLNALGDSGPILHAAQDFPDWTTATEIVPHGARGEHLA
jgi:hypothetical protein